MVLVGKSIHLGLPTILKAIPRRRKLGLGDDERLLWDLFCRRNRGKGVGMGWEDGS